MKSAGATSNHSPSTQRGGSEVRSPLAWSGSTNGFLLSVLLHGGIAAIILLGVGLLHEKPTIRPSVLQLVGSPQGNPDPASVAPSGAGLITVAIPKLPPPAAAPASVSTGVRPNTKSHLAPATGNAPASPKPQGVTPKPMSYDEFIRNHPGKPRTASAPAAATAIKHLDADGIRNDLIGSPGATPMNGTAAGALGHEQGDIRNAYIQLFREKIRGYLHNPSAGAAGLTVEIELHLLPDGSITRVRVVRSSGNAEFDQVAKEAVQRVTMPSRPPGVEEYLQVPIKGIDAN